MSKSHAQLFVMTIAGNVSEARCSPPAPAAAGAFGVARMAGSWVPSHEVMFMCVNLASQAGPSAAERASKSGHRSSISGGEATPTLSLFLGATAGGRRPGRRLIG